jgi:hypothetical protein
LAVKLNKLFAGAVDADVAAAPLGAAAALKLNKLLVGADSDVPNPVVDPALPVAFSVAASMVATATP